MQKLINYSLIMLKLINYSLIMQKIINYSLIMQQNLIFLDIDQVRRRFWGWRSQDIKNLIKTL